MGSIQAVRRGTGNTVADTLSPIFLCQLSHFYLILFFNFGWVQESSRDGTIYIGKK